MSESQWHGDWAFADPPNVAVFTLRKILTGENPVLHVTHDEDDGSWQFLDGGDALQSEAKIVCLVEMMQIDPSLVELADLPLGWRATRAAPGLSWFREPKAGS